MIGADEVVAAVAHLAASAQIDPRGHEQVVAPFGHAADTVISMRAGAVSATSSVVSRAILANATANCGSGQLLAARDVAT